jgi:hypothetical protein
LPPLVEPECRFPASGSHADSRGKAVRGPCPLSRAAQPGSQMRTSPQPRGRFFRIRTFVQAEFPSSYPDMSVPRPLRSTIVTRFLATMGRSDSRPGPLPGLFIPPGRWMSLRPPRRVSQAPRLIRPRALPLPPRKAPPLLSPLASRRVSGFILGED